MVDEEKRTRLTLSGLVWSILAGATFWAACVFALHGHGKVAGALAVAFAVVSACCVAAAWTEIFDK